MSTDFTLYEKVFGFPITEEQKKIINSSCNTVVSAGAGTGKTAVLSLRFLKLVKENKIAANRILCLTFTNKATFEMKERIEDYLVKASLSDPVLESQLDIFSKDPQVYTLDSFSKEVVYLGCSQYGIPKMFRYGSTEEIEALAKKVANSFLQNPNYKTQVDFLKERFSRTDLYKKFFIPIARYSVLDRANNGKSSLNKEASKIIQKVNYETEKALIIEKLKEVRTLALEFISLEDKEIEKNKTNFEKEYGAKLGDYEDLEEKFREKQLSELKEIEALEKKERKTSLAQFKAKWKSLEKEDELWKRVISFKDKKKNISTSNKKELLIRLVERIDECLKDFSLVVKYKSNTSKYWFGLGNSKFGNNYIKDLLEELSNSCEKIELYESVKDYEKTQESCDAFLKYLYEEKRREGFLTFHDVAHMAVDILKNNKEVRQLYKNKYDFVMIDEFQDNNSLQKDLLFLLGEKKNVQSTGVPKACDLEKNKLFFVGDKKQSIYRFRDADVSVFSALSEELIQYGGQLLELKANFRSSSDIINFNNNVFSQVLTPIENDSFEAFEAENGSLVSPNKEKTDSVIGFLPSKDNDEETLANLIEAIVSSNDLFFIPDKGQKGGFRKATYSDIAVLYKTGTIMKKLESVLLKRHIPFQVEGSKSLMESSVASDFYSILQLLLFPEDKTALASVLRSPFALYEDAKIKNVLDNGFEENNEFNYFLLGLKERAFRYSLGELLTYIWTSSDYGSYCEKCGNGSYEYFSQLFSLAVQYDDLGKDLTAFVSFLREFIGPQDSLDNRKALEPVVLHESVSGVQFMSIHKSKGLAFPIVIVYGMSDSTQGDKDENVFKIGEDICAVCNKKFFSAVYEQRSRKKEEFAESKRLLYVAMTRPRFHMVLIGPQIEGDTIKDIIALPGTFKKNKDKHFCVSLDRSSLGKNVAIDLQPWLEETLGKVNRITEIEVPVIGCENPSSVVFKKTHVGVTSLVEDSFGKSYDSLGDGRYNSLDNTLKKTGIKSTAFGELAHKALEFLVKKDMTSFENLKASFSGTDEKTLSFITNEAKAMALDFGDSVFYKSYIEGTPIENLQEELRFHTPKSSLGSLESKIDSSYEQNISVEGVIDLLVEKPTYNLIVDYKTDHYRNPEAHKDQLLVYEKTIKALYPNKRVYGVLYYLRDNKNQDVIFWDEEGREYSKIDG